MHKMPAPAATPAAAAAAAPVPASSPIPIRQTLFPGYSPGSFLSAAGFPVSVAVLIVLLLIKVVTFLWD